MRHNSTSTFVYYLSMELNMWEVIGNFTNCTDKVRVIKKVFINKSSFIQSKINLVFSKKLSNVLFEVLTYADHQNERKYPELWCWRRKEKNKLTDCNKWRRSKKSTWKEIHNDDCSTEESELDRTRSRRYLHFTSF